MRFFQVKNPHASFFCACCRAPRALRYQRMTSGANLIQIAVLTSFLTWALFPWFQWKTVGSFFVLWAGFESIRKMLYRRELPCPYCGFDATWYRRDVRVARQQVETFLKEHPDSPVFRGVSPAGQTEQMRQ